jgi:hypothetical protein
MPLTRFGLVWPVVLPCVLLCCQAYQDDEDERRCRDVTSQIDQALQDNIEIGVLMGTAVPCALTEDSFDPRVRPDSREYLLGAFHDACIIQQERCGSDELESAPEQGPPEPIPPPSAPPPYVLNGGTTNVK